MISKLSRKNLMPEPFVSQTDGVLRPFTDSEEILLFEIARFALQDADFFDMVTEDTDVSYEEMCKLRDKLQDYMEKL